VTVEKFVELKKNKQRERDERLKRQKERIKARGEKVRTVRLKKWIELAARRKIEEQLEKATLAKERRERAKNAIENAKTAISTVEKEIEVSNYVPQIMTEIDRILADAIESFKYSDYEKAISLSFEIERLVEKAKLDASRKAEENRKKREREAKYFYCAIPFSEEKNFGNIGMNNNEVYTVTYRDIAAVVSDSPMKNYEITDDNIRRHESVLRRVMKEHTVAPVEFGTTIKNERILRRLLRKAHDSIKECLKLVDDMVELGVKAILNEETVFVDHKKREECVSDILRSLNTRAKQAVTGDLFSDRLLLNASYLVKKEDVNEFSNKLRNLKEKYSMLKLLYSGPWAPFNFVYIKIGAEGMEITKK
jgi:hypothetical protein